MKNCIFLWHDGWDRNDIDIPKPEGWDGFQSSNFKSPLIQVGDFLYQNTFSLKGKSIFQKNLVATRLFRIFSHNEKK